MAQVGNTSIALADRDERSDPGTWYVPPDRVKAVAAAMPPGTRVRRRDGRGGVVWGLDVDWSKRWVLVDHGIHLHHLADLIAWHVDPGLRPRSVAPCRRPQYGLVCVVAGPPGHDEVCCGCGDARSWTWFEHERASVIHPLCGDCAEDNGYYDIWGELPQ